MQRTAPKGRGSRYRRRSSRRGRGLLPLALLLLLVLAALPVLFGAPDLVRGIFYPLPPEHAGTIRQAAAEQGVEPALVAAVIRTESGFEEGATSSRGAHGLMQLQPDTADFISERSGIAGNYRDPEANIRMGTWYLSYLGQRYGGDEALLLAAYNSGQGRVDNWLSEGGIDVRSDFPLPETREYVRNVLEARGTYAELYGRNLDRGPGRAG